MTTSSPTPQESLGALAIPNRSKLAASSSLCTSLVRRDLRSVPETDLGLLVMLSLSVCVLCCCCCCLLSVTLRLKLGSLNRPVDLEDVLSKEATSSAFSSAASGSSPVSSLISWRLRGSLTVVRGAASVGIAGRGGREGARSEPSMGVSDNCPGVSLFVTGVSVSLSSSSSLSSLSTSTSSASRYHFRRRVHRPQPSWPRRPFCHCKLSS